MTINKKLLAATIIATTCLTSCSYPEEPTKPATYHRVKKIVKAKNQAQETTYSYKYNVFKGNFYQQPDVHSVYYIVYQDGSYEKVNIGKYATTNVGDTITKNQPQ